MKEVFQDNLSLSHYKFNDDFLDDLTFNYK